METENPQANSPESPQTAGGADKPELNERVGIVEAILFVTGNAVEKSEICRAMNLTEEELVVFDILTRPAPELGPDERAEVKKVARELLVRIRALLVLNWRQKAAARSQLRLAIEDTLDTGLPRAYAPDMYRQKCAAVFEHVYESYPERNAGVYA